MVAAITALVLLTAWAARLVPLSLTVATLALLVALLLAFHLSAAHHGTDR